MAKGGKRKGAGRPPGNPGEAYQRVSITVSGPTLIAIDAYAKSEKLSRSAAIEKLALAGLKNL